VPTGRHLPNAARQVVDWVRPDFVDLNFGCPVNKVVCKNGGSALLKDCPTLASVAAAVVRAIAPIPVTAKIRIGWDADSINAARVARILAERNPQSSRARALKVTPALPIERFPEGGGCFHPRHRKWRSCKCGRCRETPP
jgi:hypothetical protein